MPVTKFTKLKLFTEYAKRKGYSLKHTADDKFIHYYAVKLDLRNQPHNIGYFGDTNGFATDRGYICDTVKEYAAFPQSTQPSQ
jgi:hypothetical protein